MSKTSTYDVLDSLDHDGERYVPGAQVALSDAAATPLIALGVVRARETGAGEGEELHGAIEHLLSEDPQREREDWWTSDGRPDTRVLSELVGKRISAQARDAAWAQAQPQT